MRSFTNPRAYVQQHAPAHWIIRAMLWRKTFWSWFWRWLPVGLYLGLGLALIAVAHLRGL